MSDFIPSTELKKRQKSCTPLKALAAVAVIACIAVLAYFAVTTAFRLVNTSFQTQANVALSEQTVLTSLNEANPPAPDLAAFAYIDTSNFVGPRFENVSVGEPFEGEGADEGKPCRDVTVTATYRNESVSVVVPLSQQFVYHDDGNKWVPGDLKQGSPQVTPLSAPRASAIEPDIPSLLESYDAELAKQFADCDVLLDPSLDETGGTIDAKLNTVKDGQLLECTVNLNITWSDSHGWQAVVSSATDVQKTETTKTDKKDKGADKKPVTLACTEGGPVSVTGTIETFSGHTLLKTDAETTVSIDGKSWTVSYFELTTQDPSLSVELGSHVTLQGTISSNGSLSDAPLVVLVTGVQAAPVEE